MSDRDALSEALWRHQPRQTLLRGVERCICGDGTVGEPGWFRRHQRDALQAAAVRLIADERAEALREAAGEFESVMGEVWGEDASWFTTGNKVAGLVAGVLREWADEDYRVEADA